MSESSASNTLLGILNKQEGIRLAKIKREKARIKNALERTSVFMENSGGSQGSVEPIPGASGTGDPNGIVTGGHTEKKRGGYNPH